MRKKSKNQLFVSLFKPDFFSLRGRVMKENEDRQVLAQYLTQNSFKPVFLAKKHPCIFSARSELLKAPLTANRGSTYRTNVLGEELTKRLILRIVARKTCKEGPSLRILESAGIAGVFLCEKYWFMRVLNEISG